MTGSVALVVGIIIGAMFAPTIIAFVRNVRGLELLIIAVWSAVSPLIAFTLLGQDSPGLAGVVLILPFIACFKFEPRDMSEDSEKYNPWST